MTARLTARRRSFANSATASARSRHRTGASAPPARAGQSWRAVSTSNISTATIFWRPPRSACGSRPSRPVMPMSRTPIGRRWRCGLDGTYVLADIIRPDLAAIERDAEAATATSEFWAPPAALLYRREIVKRIGGWPAGLPVIQDARYLFEAARHKARFAYVAGVGAYYRVSPDSLSRRNLTRFIADCARNASEIETIWRAQGALAPSRVDALARMWAHVVKAALLNGLDEFEEARARYNGLATRRSLFETGCLLRRMVGASAAASVLQAGLQSKRMLRRWTAGDAGLDRLAVDR